MCIRDSTRSTFFTPVWGLVLGGLIPVLLVTFFSVGETDLAIDLAEAAFSDSLATVVFLIPALTGFVGGLLFISRLKRAEQKLILAQANLQEVA